jgi:hypothetical protein
MLESIFHKVPPRSCIVNRNKILAAKAAGPASATSALEAEVDRLVYTLYGLTEEEIKVVEGKDEKTRV